MKRSRSVLALCQFAITLVPVIGVAVFASTHHSQNPTDTRFDYQPVRQVSGTIRVCGSPQMADLFRLYRLGFGVVQPNVRFESNLDSTLTAASEVARGGAEIGLLGRELWPSEANAFATTKGHPPLAIRIATGSYDIPKVTFALMVFVPRANPITALSISQLERIFADSQDSVHTWGELGLTGSWAERPIHLYGFAKDNDKSRVFRSLVFKQGEPWSAAMKEFSNALGPDGIDAGDLIIRAVGSDPDGIGISNVHYATSAVKALPLSLAGALAPVSPTRESVADGTYPLSRAVYMIVDPEKLSGSGSTSSAISEFLRFVLSEQGARAVREDGNYLPLMPAIAEQEINSIP